ncbi:MAG TPA: hypothetical protein PK977_15485, partial [Chitinophagaceae bacterium]|nr:hypothetical protein [Chitinophagaceae bacterium]
MGKRILFILFVFVFSITVSSGQNEKKLDSLISLADSLSRNKNFTAALEVNLSAVDLLKKLKENSYFQAMSPVVMLNTGTCYKELGDVKNAHRFMTYSLQLARSNKVHLDIELAFISLNSLHKHISISNLSFDYPVVPATEELGMFYVISKIEKVSADSVRIIIQGGKYDGIDDSVKKGGIISRYDVNKKNERPFGLVNCYIREINNNYCVAYARDDSVLYIKEGDLVELKTRVPIFWRKLDIGKALLRAISYSTYYREQIFHPRYLYYYADSLTNRDLAAIFKN